MKRALEITLALAAVGLLYWVAVLIYTPLQFEKEVKTRSAVVIQKLTDIRAAQRQYQKKYHRFTGSFDTLEMFILNDSIAMERKKFNEDDSVGMASLKKGEKNIEIYLVPAREVAFEGRKLTEAQIKDLRYIPYNKNKKEFHLSAGQTTEGVIMGQPTVECYALFEEFLDMDKYKQEIINMVDQAPDAQKIILDKSENVQVVSAGYKFGDKTTNNNEAGNWGE